MIDGDMNQKEAVSQADKKIDRFIVLMKRRLGRGNFSEVYAGVDTGNHCQVAIKIVSLNSLSSDITRRLFSREVCILKTISHPNVLKCFQVLSSPNNFYICTELCQGGDLEKLTRGRPMREEKIGKLVVDIFNGMKYLHEQGILHRDLKITNILLDAEGNAKIADFGFALRANKPTKDIQIGSLAYMSPQSMLEHRYSIKSDVWSFGLLLYELLHGDIPLGKCKSLEELRKTVFKPIEYNKNLSSDLKQFLQSCLTIDCNKRISTFDMLQTAYLKRVSQEQAQLRKQQDTYSQLSTCVSWRDAPLELRVLSYKTAVSLLHYTRLIHKTISEAPSAVLSRWLLKLAHAMLNASLDVKDRSKEDVARLAQVIRQYYAKYMNEHQQALTMAPFSEFSWQELVQQVRLLMRGKSAQRFSLILSETTFFWQCLNKRNIQCFGKDSQSEQYLRR